MAYSESLAERTRQILARRRGIAEKKMFGGVAFLLHGNLCLCVWKTYLIVRLHPGDYAAALTEPEVRPFDVTGRPMKGWVMVEPDGIESDVQLQRWVERAVDFVETLPGK